MIPQILYLALVALSLFINMYKHGEVKKEEKYNFYKHAFYTALAFSIVYSGGFFDVLFK